MVWPQHVHVALHGSRKSIIRKTVFSFQKPQKSDCKVEDIFVAGGEDFARKFPRYFLRIYLQVVKILVENEIEKRK